jgi:hypothetical protein
LWSTFDVDTSIATHHDPAGTANSQSRTYIGGAQLFMDVTARF